MTATYIRHYAASHLYLQTDFRHANQRLPTAVYDVDSQGESKEQLIRIVLDTL